LSRSRAESIETANDNKTATLCTLLIEVSRTPQALGDDAEQVKALLSEGATFECTDTEYRRTPLIWAIVTGRQDLVKLFLDGTLLGEKASLDTYDGKWLWPPIVWAVVEDKPDILDVLIRQGADLTVTDTRYGRTALLWAASLGRSCALRVLIESDLGPGPVNALDKDGMTALALSYSDGHRETAELLVKVGADPNFRFRNGSSLLEWTILAKDEDFARLLLDNGAEAKSITTSGVSPLILATQKNLPVAAETLVEKGADVQCLDDEGLSALTVAIKDQREEIAAMLIRNGAAVNARDPEGNAPLLWAIGRQNERLVRMLIKSGATLASADVEAMLVWAEQTGNEEIGHLVLTGSGQHPLNSNGSGLVRRLGMSTAQPEDDADGRVRCNSNS
jgi:ankyrin repeat protein